MDQPGGGGAFRDLFDLEEQVIDRARGRAVSSALPPDNGAPVSKVSRSQKSEARVLVAGHKRVGLCLSGGGIRSATFNLGVLQGLDECEVLPQVDYLSTVSGGGYIGGWWSAWLRRRSGTDHFPRREDGGEHPAIRHVREFGNFLVPRGSAFGGDFWRAVVAALSAMIPGLLAGAWVLAALLVVCRVGLATVAISNGSGGPWVAGVGAGLVTFIAELSWVGRRRAEYGGIWPTVLISGLVGLGAGILVSAALIEPWPGSLSNGLLALGELCASCERLKPAQVGAMISVPASWLVIGTAGILLRFFTSRLSTRPHGASFGSLVDRTIGRLIVLALLWLLLAGIWEAAARLPEIIGVAQLGITSLASGGLAALIVRALGGSNEVRAPIERLLRVLPRLLSYLALIAASILTARLLLLAAPGSTDLGWIAGTYSDAWKVSLLLMGAPIVLLMLLFDPSNVSLHPFYRGRIVRTFLGASNPAARSVADNRHTDPRAADDLPLTDLATQHPIHLICCAANDLNGDPIAGLGRGAASAVLSARGLSIGDAFEPQPDLTLGSALTASGAAFNSSMGSYSMKLGFAVGFVMTALNLRLGLWRPRPGAPTSWVPRIPGLRFFAEMLGITAANRPPESWLGKRLDPGIHLSDGGHFENLGLYELVRRHCRYVIACDAGADPTVAFGDLGNAIRRVREDFGVEIELDLSMLAPNECGFSERHVAIGTIDYGDHDKGILVYLKPTLTGDEPRDVLQYRSENDAFPHESTGDQLYDEAQWESYRRLGQHIAREIFRFMERSTEVSGPEAIFSSVRAEWYPTPPNLNERLAHVLERADQLTHQLREDGPRALLDEVFPELANGRTEPGPEDGEKILGHVLSALQLMEQAWIACYFETHWSHPLNTGLINYLSRWTNSRSVRAWWPIMRTLHSPHFQRFAEDRLGLASCRSEVRITAHQGSNGARWRDGFAASAWARTLSEAELTHKLTGDVRVFLAELAGVDPSGARPVQVGLAVVRIDDRVARLDSGDLFVPPGLWGAGIGTELLHSVCHALVDAGPGELRVNIEHEYAQADADRGLRGDAGSRQAQRDLIEFYVRAGFRNDGDGTLVRATRRRRSPSRAHSTAPRA